MSDFGTEMGNRSLSMMEKMTEALLKLIGKIYDASRNPLDQSGAPLTAVGVLLDDKGFKELAGRCKREGIRITGIENMKERDAVGMKAMTIVCKQSELPKLANLVDLINAEKKIEKINGEIQKNAGNQPVIDELNRQIEVIRRGHSQALNHEQTQGIVEQAVNGQRSRGVDFDEAMNRWTGGKMDRDTVVYMVDAKDPNRHIVCMSRQDRFKMQEYIRTNYEVYNGDKPVYATSDKRFDGRPKAYWLNEKAAMKSAGGFGDQILKFSSKNEWEAYRGNYQARNRKGLDDLAVGNEGRNYGAIINHLETKISEYGAEYQDGQTRSSESGKVIALTENMNDAEKINAAEAAVIGKQIANYKEIKELESEVAIARTNMLITDGGTAEHSSAQAEFQKAEAKYHAALSREKVLREEKMSVNAVKAVQDTANMEKPDDRRSERVIEIDRDKMTMADYKGKIADMKAENGAKGNELKEVNRNNKKVILPEKPGR